MNLWKAVTFWQKDKDGKEVRITADNTNTGSDVKGREGMVALYNQSSVVAASLHWIQRSFLEAPLTVATSEGLKVTYDVEHELVQLLRTPPYMDSTTAWRGIIRDYYQRGIGYHHKQRNRLGQVVSLVRVPSKRVEPKGNKLSGRINYYAVDVNSSSGNKRRIPVEDMIVYRADVDDDDLTRSRAPLDPALDDVKTDVEAAKFQYELLEQYAVPNGVISPRNHDASMPVPEAYQRELLRDYKKSFGRGKRGETMVADIAVDVHSLGYSPRELVLKDQRRIAEERICGTMGVPAILAGMGAGLDAGRYANASTLRREAYENCLVPLQVIIASALTRWLLPEFSEDPNLSVRFDYTQVVALLDSRDEVSDRVREEMLTGVITRHKAQEQLGYDNDTITDARYVPTNVLEVKIDEPPVEHPDNLADAGPGTSSSSEVVSVASTSSE